VPRHRDLVVSNGAVRLNVRDYGGQGTPVLLIHGAGRSLLDWEPMVPQLLISHRVAGFDLRGHGGSSDGPWDWTMVQDDCQAVITELGYEQPALVGHSLGGMIAAMLATVPGRCRVAVNLDGHGSLPANQYVGMHPDTVTQLLGEQAREVRQALAALTQPKREVAAKLLDDVAALDLFEVYRAGRATLLIVQAQQLPEGGAAAMLARAHRDGTALVLEELAARHPHIHYQRVEATHALIFEQPEALATSIRDFIAMG
jgi:pimeloyl-ACP methyl ester carboxylesterase